jgi:hypothetical protein
VPRLRRYLRHCVTEDQKASAIRLAREEMAVELEREWVMFDTIAGSQVVRYGASDC